MMDIDGPYGLRPRWPGHVAKALLATVPVLVMGWFIHLMDPAPSTHAASRDADGTAQVTPRLRDRRPPAPVIPDEDPEVTQVRRIFPLGYTREAAQTFIQTVYIRTYLPDGQQAYGSGFVLREGVVVTAAHVLKEDVAPPQVGCLTNGGQREVDATVIVADHDRDIAVLDAPECSGQEILVRDAVPLPDEPLLTSGFHFGAASGMTIILQEQMRSSVIPGVELVPDDDALSQDIRSDETVSHLVEVWRDRGIPPAYGMSGALIPGKSGSPVFAHDGSIVGMVIITAPQHNRSYAVPPGNILFVLRQAGL